MYSEYFDTRRKTIFHYYTNFYTYTDTNYPPLPGTTYGLLRILS